MSNSNTVKVAIIIVAIAVVFLGLLATGIINLGDSNRESDIKNSDSSLSQAQTDLTIGDRAPDFTLTTIDGINLTLRGLQGKILVITSGAAWCPTCIIENKNFNPVYQEVKNKGVEFITVDIDPIDDEKAIKEFQKLYAPWHNVQQVNAKKLIKDYGFWRFEITYIIDKDGIIRFKDSGITSTQTLTEELNKLL